MNNLIPTEKMSSREIAELTGKEHRNVLADCDILNENYEKLGLLKIQQTQYTHSQNGQSYREYILTKIQCMDLMTGYRVELRIKVNRRWEELEQKQQFKIPQSYSEALKLAASQAEQIEQQQQTIKEQQPAVLFSQCVGNSTTNISVGDMAKLLNQNGINIGQNRLYDWLVTNKYLLCRQRWSKKREKYVNDYMASQKAADLKVFHVGEYPVVTVDATFIKHTVKVTGKGQIYFINKFLKLYRNERNKSISM